VAELRTSPCDQVRSVCPELDPSILINFVCKTRRNWSNPGKVCSRRSQLKQSVVSGEPWRLSCSGITYFWISRTGPSLITINEWPGRCQGRCRVVGTFKSELRLVVRPISIPCPVHMTIDRLILNHRRDARRETTSPIIYRCPRDGRTRS
jgi:hypothetical protein